MLITFFVFVGVVAVVVILSKGHTAEPLKPIPERAASEDEVHDDELVAGLVQGAVDLHQAYWSPDPDAKAKLLDKTTDELSDDEKLRLLHLMCIDLMWNRLDDEDMNEDIPDGPERDRMRELRDALMCDGKPQSPVPTAMAWLGHGGGGSEARPPDHTGRLCNASLTHLGLLEVVRIDEKDMVATCVSFIPLASIARLMVAGASLMSAARISYTDGRDDEKVLVPGLYGLSYHSPHAHDQDGSRTRFPLHLQHDDEDDLRHHGPSMGIGIGTCDFHLWPSDVDDEEVEGSQEGDPSGHVLFGISALNELVQPLSISDPDFDAKAKQRGIDPDEARRMFEKSQTSPAHAEA